MEETERHAERVATCLEAHGESPSKVKAAPTISLGAMKAPLDMARGEKGMRTAREGSPPNAWRSPPTG